MFTDCTTTGIHIKCFDICRVFILYTIGETLNHKHNNIDGFLMKFHSFKPLSRRYPIYASV